MVHYFILQLITLFLAIITFLFPCNFSPTPFSHHLCLSWHRRGVSIVDLPIHMQSKSHIPHAYPSSQLFHKAHCLVFFNCFYSFFKMYFHFLWLPAFSLAWFCCLSLLNLKYHMNMLYSISHKYNFQSWQSISFI